MRAIILAAGRGLRLKQAADMELPKCLLAFGGRTLLERHLQLLGRAGVSEVVLALGFLHQTVEAQLAGMHAPLRPSIVLNSRYELGSVLTLHTAAGALSRGGDVLVMDADVLYHERIMAALVAGTRPANRILIDRDFEPGPEPVKVCVRNGVPVELRKQVAPDLSYDTIGESIGFFRFSERGARRLAAIVADYVESGRANMPHEEAVRDLLLESGPEFEVADVTGAPWIEIDFPVDVERAAREILPHI
ncbi:MAG TPA: phosphocholine cytidylyltransferase family protein [Steroidobacteraceae bacterium]|nr:phosphocholine cytidylyltransferase family protein [Steroidobacteraceae bacterium]